MRMRRGWRSHRQYRKLRKAFLARNPLCVGCATAGRTEAAAEVDHIRPVALGGEPYCVENLQPLCRTCHESKTDRESPHRPRLTRGAEWDALIDQQKRTKTC